jgi:DNA polymerase-3 subunit gamma/tau
MYDEINRKGFEGDTVLDGFSEFLRNLLVSRDAKVAMLLEVAEDFKQKYLQTAQKIPASFIISALNILNESELNYKQSRNKRLHVELTIIKLSYLQQALELVNNDGVVSKKKLIDGAKTIAFRALPIERLKQSTAENPTEQAVQRKQPASPQVQPEAKLIIEEPSPVIKKSTVNPPTGNQSTATTAIAPKATLGSLNKIRQQIAQQNQNGNNAAVQITEDELYVCWGQFIEKLRGKSNFSAVTNFKAAELKVIDNNTIEIITQGEIHKAFIEVERADLVTHLQQHFNNRLLTYQVLVIEKEDTAVETDLPLTRKQQYLKIIEEYPLVKELKERLKLELD